MTSMLNVKVLFKNHRLERENDILQFINRAVNKSLNVLDLNIKINTPVQHGNLRRSITTKMTGVGSGEVFTAPLEGGKEIDYAVHVEYGTKYMAPRAMFRKGVAQSEDKIKQIFEQEAKNVIK